MSGRAPVPVLAAVVLLAACSVTEGPSGETPVPENDAAPAFSAEVEELCEPVFEEHRRLAGVDGERKFEEVAAAVTRAEQELVDGLARVEAPSGVEDDLAAYVDALEEYSDAQATAVSGKGPAARSLADIVRAARTGVRLHELGERMGVPDVCPPPPTVDPHTTLFVAEANRDCFELWRGVRRSDVGPRRPQSQAEAIELLDSLRRFTAGITRSLRRSLPDTSTIRIRRIVRLGETRLRALEAARQALAAADVSAYEKAARKLVRVGRRHDRQMLSVGLIECTRTFGRAGS